MPVLVDAKEVQLAVDGVHNALMAALLNNCILVRERRNMKTSVRRIVTQLYLIVDL